MVLGVHANEAAPRDVEHELSLLRELLFGPGVEQVDCYWLPARASRCQP